MDYFKIGNRLKLERERKGLSYEQIFEVTRIQPSILKEIEDGKATVAPVFLKGFIKTYARFLGLNPEELFNQEKEKTDQKDELKEEIKTPGTNDANKKQSRVTYLLLLLGFFIVFQMIWFGWPINFSTRNTATEDKNSSFKTTERENIPIGDQGDLNAKAPDQQQEHPTLFDQIKEAVFKEDLLIRSSEALEIYFKADQQSTITKILEPSIWFHIKAKKNIYLRFDENRGDIQIFYNGQQVDIGSRSFFERTFQRQSL